MPVEADPVTDLLDIEIDWFYSTKEKLSPEAVRVGLLDHGLFGEKVPPCFVSKGLAAIANEAMTGVLDEADEKKLRKSIDDAGHDYVRYEALRDINIPRHLGIPHPECYAVQALAISKHWKEIAEHCNRPQPAISRVHVRHVGNGCVFEMNYKGIERFQLEEDEVRWMAGAQYLVEADIAACFPSIYTHCIPWALHGKPESKQKSSLTALSGNLLDKCTQNTRDRQTNGLLISPHASNIVSEIILTRVDTELQSKGYARVVRHVDDYKFYASTYEEAEGFIRDLGLCLRTYEMSLNEKKTQILSLPRPSDANWRLVLNRFIFPTEKEIRFSVIRSYLDLALECAQAFGKSTPLNYAIKTLAGHEEPRKLNGRAKRMYSQEAMNLALAFPYLAPLLDECVFTPYWHVGMQEKIADFSTALIRLGAKKIYPDAIAQALFLALKYQIGLGVSEAELAGIVQLDDCVANVLLLEYAKKQGLKKVQATIKKRAAMLKVDDARERDRQWLLIYQTWSIAELKGNGQGFLAMLKGKGFEFFAMPTEAPKKVPTAAVPSLPPQAAASVDVAV
ncbi:MAG: RNA-directed DNA polymerase [Phycisphaerales bacterium]